MTRTDKILIILIILVSMAGAAALQLPLFAQGNPAAVIKVRGETVRSIDLRGTASDRIIIQGIRGVSVLEVREGKIRMVSSSCPDKLCIQQGWAEKPGQAIVCVPNAVSVSIEGDGGVDSIVR